MPREALSELHSRPSHVKEELVSGAFHVLFGPRSQQKPLLYSEGRHQGGCSR